MRVERHFDGNGLLVASKRQETAKSPRVKKSNIIQPEPWPVVLLPLKLLAKPLDRGAGDIIARVIGPIGGDAFKKWYKTIFGKSCGCGQRQDALNKRWPL